jgi:zinc protease
MCFNGTKNFKKNELVDYLQSVGVKFGADINAYTSFDETVYMLTLPTDKQDIVNKGFQILEDWAHNVSFDNEEIDKERGVVIEEWRLGRGAGQRLRDKTFPVIFKDSRYAQRLPIGKKEILESCKYETLKKFYQDWYRPDLMAVIVVGDLDLNEMEAKVKEHFAGIQPAASPKERKVYGVPDHKGTLVATATDKEATIAQIQLLFKREPEEIKTYGDARKQIIYELLGGMIGRRFSEITQKPNAPFNFAFGFYRDILRSKGAFTVFATLNDANIDKALRTLLTENKKVFEYGFNQAELENYKKEVLANYERAYNDRDKTESQNYTFEYVDSFLTGHAIPSIEWFYEFTSKTLPTITVDEINQTAKSLIKEDNFVVSITGPEKDTTKNLGEEPVRIALKEVAATKVEPYTYKEITQPLMVSLPTPGKVTKESKIDTLGATELVLSNGVKVILKPTDFKNDEIRMRSFSFGGSSLISDEDAPSASAAAGIIANSGVGNFSDTDLEKLLSGKNTYAFPYITPITEGINAGSTPKELETMLQLVNLYFTQPRKDESAFAAVIAIICLTPIISTSTKCKKPSVKIILEQVFLRKMK